MQNAAAHGRPHLELAGLDRRIAKPYNAERREELKLERDKLRERMAAGEFGPDEPPPPAR